MPQVSVIVPVYNVEKYIHRCVDSVLNQTFRDFELILVDDGSPDNCPAICNKYAAKDSRIRVIHQANGGLSLANNAGLNAAQGEFVAFCDSDDYWEKNLLETAVAALRAKQADCVLFAYNAFNDEVTKKVRDVHSAQYDFHNDQDNVDYLIQLQLAGKHGWERWTHVFRRDIIEKYHVRCCATCKGFAEDLGFVCRYMLHSKRLVCIPDVLYNYYLREDSMMRSSKTLVRLNDLSEVAWDVWQDFDKTVKDPKVRKQFPIMYFAIMNNQLRKMYQVPDFSRIPEEIAKLHRIHWWKENIRKLYFCYGALKKHYGKHQADRVMLFLTYLQHGNWKLYSLESGLYYKWYNKTKR